MDYRSTSADQGAPMPNEQSIGQLFASAARLSGSTWIRLLHERLEVGWTAFNVLRQLESADGQTLKEVAVGTMVAASTLTGVLDTLEKDGLVERRRSGADRRVIHLYLTVAGRERLALSAAQLPAEFDVLFDHVEAADAPAIRRFLLASIERLSAELDLPRRPIARH